MSQLEREIIETFEKVIPEMSEVEKAQLLSFGEGVAFMKSLQKQEQEEKVS